jgi:hypothetical protein
MNYSEQFMMMRCMSTELQDPIFLESVKKSGFKWIRPIYGNFYNSLRFPTVGRPVELFCVQNFRCVPLNSAKARTIINKLCYYM